MGKLRLMMKCITWREVREVWRKEALGHPKLKLMGKLMGFKCEDYCVTMKYKWQRNLVFRLVGGWRNVLYKQISFIYKNC